MPSQKRERTLFLWETMTHSTVRSFKNYVVAKGRHGMNGSVVNPFIAKVRFGIETQADVLCCALTSALGPKPSPATIPGLVFLLPE